ncbi:MAG: GNAT family N-acetyltransferase [Pseudomonadales bacterium]
MSGYHLTVLDEGHAREILTWRYPAPYDFYNPPLRMPLDDYVREFTNPAYCFHAVLSPEQTFVGFCSYGIDGQVPGGDYEQEALDIGLGMKPELTGNGLGKAFFEAILNFSILRFEPDLVRLTVADFNQRAVRLYRGFGFESRESFVDAGSNIPYTVLIKEISMDHAS